jgi:hypothetical protein
MSAKKVGGKTIVLTLGVLCIVLLIVLAVVMVNCASVLENKDSQIDTLKKQISSLQNSDVANLSKQIADRDAQIANLMNERDSLNLQISILSSQIESLKAQIAQNCTSELSTQEKMRDSIMDYIKFNHPETATFMKDLVWTGGRTTPPNLIGAETYVYTSDGWKFTINYPVVPNPEYNITADYSATSISIPYRIIWQGSWQNWCVNETSYVFAQ